ncbi:MAG: hypothetical protein RLZZ21_943 [Planctomycetota bacterium]|jgi:hypothetical protein
MPRFAILEHTGAPDDPAGRHYDLLLEAGDACRTWRLAELPVPGGPPVPAVELPPHRLAWLDHVAGEVSGGRGFARRIAAGEYVVGMSDATNLMDATRLAVQLTNTIEPTRVVLAYDAARWIAARE